MRNDPDPSPRLLSVGHSNHELPDFLRLLQGAGVTAVADVRSHPFSQRLPQFNRPDLERALRACDIGYTFLGDDLGGRPRPRDLYDAEGRVDYEKVRTTAAFRRGLARLLEGLEWFTVAMLCSEADPLDCHRGLMITPALLERGVSPIHLRRDGSQETTAEMEERLLALTGVGKGVLDGLFAAAVTPEERRQFLAEAYRAHARRKAFRQRPDPAPGSSEDGEDCQAE
jgi:uncharacterized protein (DUF488 family)